MFLPVPAECTSLHPPPAPSRAQRGTPEPRTGRLKDRKRQSIAEVRAETTAFTETLHTTTDSMEEPRHRLLCYVSLPLKMKHPLSCDH
uniref:Uncharacterized protein n=1 Tax=Anguilla anguilla TaxID=7936 RepID=A0A0E9V5R2_ANGAN